MTECPVCRGLLFSDHDELACRTCGRRWYPADDQPAIPALHNLCECGIEISFKAKRCQPCSRARTPDPKQGQGQEGLAGATARPTATNHNPNPHRPENDHLY